jgi:hypothetical protein
MEKIDFVLPWVDGSDKEWLALKRKYESAGSEATSADSDDNGENRYRDYGLLKYWFRAVERFAPWVNRVFFVTCGQKPGWLDESNPKLRLVNHKDYIPSDYLPTFQSNTIELNLHRIPDLSEHFVLFNDDTVLLRPISPDFFFRNGLPVLSCDIGIPRWLSAGNIGHVVINNCGILKQNMDVERLVWKHIWKYVNIRRLGFARAAKNFASIAVNRTVIPGTFGHLPQPHLKSTFDEIWSKAPHVMDRTSRNRFRNNDCVNQWIACAWNMISGRFCPANEKRRGLFLLINAYNLPRFCDAIKRQSFPQLCWNDKEYTPEIEHCFHEVSKAFGILFPEKSSFEK